MPHIGPTAQDFHTTFGLNGEDETRSTDLHVVDLAAIQGLNEKVEKLKYANAQFHANLAYLEARLSVHKSKS